MRTNTNTADSSKRAPGREFRALVWAARHPGMSLSPAGMAAVVITVGPTASGIAVGGATSALGCWYRGHPDTFDYYAAPVLRAWRRRWTRYVGTRWADVMEDCNLTLAHRKTGQIRVPRVLRVRSYSPTTDTVTVRMVRGQSMEDWNRSFGAAGGAQGGPDRDRAHEAPHAGADRAARGAVPRCHPGSGDAWLVGLGGPGLGVCRG